MESVEESVFDSQKVDLMIERGRSMFCTLRDSRIELIFAVKKSFYSIHFKAETIGFPTANGLKHLVNLFTRNIRTCQKNILIGR